MAVATSDWLVCKRDGRVVPYDASRILKAISNAFRAELKLGPQEPLDKSIVQQIHDVLESVSEEIIVRASQSINRKASRCTALLRAVK